ncbi:V-type ATP synthase subunit F [Thermococcus sp.]
MKIVVMGDKDTVLGFKLAGVHETYAFGENDLDTERAKNKINELIDKQDVGIILITERLARRIEVPTVTFPIILQIPDKTGSRFGEEQLKEIVRKAIGVELKR